MASKATPDDDTPRKFTKNPMGQNNIKEDDLKKGANSHRTLDTEDDEREPTDEEMDMRAKRCLRIFHVLLLIVGGAVCGGALYISTFALGSTASTLVYTVAGGGGALFAITILGMIGSCGSVYSRLLLIYYTCLVFLCFAFLVIGGFCFILTSAAVSYVNDNWVSLSQSLPASFKNWSESQTDQYTRMALYVVGGVSFLLWFLIMIAMSNVARLVTPVKAYTILLQATNIALLPVGIALIGAAIFVAETAVGGSAPIAAFSIFILGIFVICLLLMGAIGTSLRSRGLIRLFMFLTAVLGLAFLAFGVLSLVQADEVTAFITSQWASIRRVLPSTFEGKYDQQAFSDYISANLTALGFLALCTGALLVMQAFAAHRLRQELRLESEAEQEMLEAAGKGLISQEAFQALTAHNQPTRAQVLWKQQWTKGTRTSRRIILCGCITLGVIAFIVVAIAAIALYYATECVQLDTYSETQEYNQINFAPYLYVHNNYSRGDTTVAVSNNQTTVTITFTKKAFKSGMATSDFPPIGNQTVTVSANGVDYLGTGAGTNFTAYGITTLMAPPTDIIGYDISCQDSEVVVTFPSATLIGGNGIDASNGYPLAIEFITGSSYAGIDLDFSSVDMADRPRIRRSDVYASIGPVDVNSMLIGYEGITATTDQGEITMENTQAQCDPDNVGTGIGGIQLVTNEGGITVTSLITLNCDVSLTGSAALTQLSNSTVQNSLGGATVSMTSAQGVMEVDTTVTDVLNLKSDSGSITVTSCNISEAIKAATQSGAVSIQSVNIAQRGGIQVDTDSGDITIYCSQFAGIITIVTGGPITCSGKGFQGSQPCEVTTPPSENNGLNVVEQVNVNCDEDGSNNCPYLGQVTVTSTSGAVTLQMDSWDIGSR